MRRQYAFALVVSSLIGTWSVSAQPPSLTVGEAVALYAQGERTRAVRDLRTARVTVTAFTKALDGWIAAAIPGEARRRERVAAAFALDAIWAATRNPLNDQHANSDLWNRVRPSEPDRVLIERCYAQTLVTQWVVRVLPSTDAPDRLERLLWMTAIGIAEDGHAWHQLQHDLLPLADKRLPDEPRLKLAHVLARTNASLGSLRLTTTVRNDVLRPESLSSGVTRRIPDAVRELATLTSEPSLAGEAEVRMGYLELRHRDWIRSLAHLDAARRTASEPTLVAAADYFAGWVHEQQNNPGSAIDAYRRALKIAPTMRNLATRLSALLFLANERAEAYEVLDRALNARPASLDLLIAVERADARFVPEWLTSIRQALP